MAEDPEKIGEKIKETSARDDKDAELDHELDESMHASDPPSSTQPHREKQQEG